MKHLNLKMTLTVIGTAVIFWAAPLRGESSNTRFEIPFAFVAGNETMPAGHYEVVQDEFARVLLRTAAETRFHGVLLAARYESRPLTSVGKSQLQFKRYGSTYFLTAVWGPQDAQGRTVAKTKRLLEAVNQAGKSTTPVATTIDGLR